MHHPPILDRAHRPRSDRAPETRTAPASASCWRPTLRSPRVVCGHVHRTIFGALGGCGVVICPSTYAQTTLEIGMTEFTVTDEPPGFAVHAWVRGALP